jgi:Mg-chelatase subunit ChlD
MSKHLRIIKSTLFMIFSIFIFGDSWATDMDSMNIPQDVMLVLDNSGSMQKNDPSILAKPAVQKFAETLSPLYRIGIIIFSDNSQLVLPLTPASDTNTRSSIDTALGGLNYKGLLTNSPSGIEKALYELREHGLQNAVKSIIFMTDGIVDVGSKIGSLNKRSWLLTNLCQESKKLGIKIFCIAFSEEADFQLLQVLAYETGAAYFRLFKPEELNDAFEKIHKNLIIAKKNESVSQPSQQPSTTVTTLSNISTNEIGKKETATNIIMSKETIALLIVLLLMVILVGLILSRLRLKKRRIGKSEPPKAELWDVANVTNGHVHPIKDQIFKIGRHPGNNLCIPKETVSNLHAIIFYENGIYYIQDQRSINGTRINGKTVTGKEPLKGGDTIRIDTYAFVFKFGPDLGATMIHNPITIQETDGDETKIWPGLGNSNKP